MRLLLEQRGERLPITEEVVRAAVGNTGRVGYMITQVLLDQRGERLPISEEVVRAAAPNTGWGNAIMRAATQQGHFRI